MDHSKQKVKKPSSMDDIKSLTENLKIREILRTVRKNSLRLAAKPGKKVMENKHINESEGLFEELSTNHDQQDAETSATNANVVFDNSTTVKNILNIENIRNVTFNDQQLTETSDLFRSEHLEFPPSETDIPKERDNKKPTITYPHVQSTICGSDFVQKSDKPTESVISTTESNNQGRKEESFSDISEKPVVILEQYQIEKSKIQCAYDQSGQNSEKNLDQETESQLKEEYSKHTEKYTEDKSKNQFEGIVDTPENHLTDSNEGNIEKQSRKQFIEESQNLSIQFEEKCKIKYKTNPNMSHENSLEKNSNIEHAVKQSNEQSNCAIDSVISPSNDMPEIQLELDSKNKLLNNSPEISINTEVVKNVPVALLSNEIPKIIHRNRKLSLDQTMLIRREGMSQSELDLHYIGKLPLERKSSFFRKKMDSFFRNTTELFKKQSFSNKPQQIQRRGSMSVSLQSLSEKNSGFSCNLKDGPQVPQHTQEEIQRSATSLNNSPTMERSASSTSVCHSEAPATHVASQEDLVASQPALHVTPALGDYPSNSVHSLNESYLRDSILQNRAISMSSGLDAIRGCLRRKKSSVSNKSHRVTWLASEDITNYFHRMSNNDHSQNIREGQSGQDYSNKSDNKNYSKSDSKGRRLSYRRAVSGEDPVLPSRYQDSSLRRKKLGEHLEENPEISHQLSEYLDKGVPKLKGFERVCLNDDAQQTLSWAQNKKNLVEFIADEVTHNLPLVKSIQAGIFELISTEADYLLHLQVLVEVFLAAAHALQDNGMMLDVVTDRLFLNLPDIYNANLKFWESTFYPMIQDTFQNGTPFNAMLMERGFSEISTVFAPYEKYAIDHPRANEYLRSLSGNADFATYLTWCHAQKGCQRLQITDLLVKPIQRITKYNLMLKRIWKLSEDEAEMNSVQVMDVSMKTFVAEINRCVKQRQEQEKAENYYSSIENLDVDTLQANFQEFRDEEMDEYYKMFSHCNLQAQMLNCHSEHSRSVIHDGELRFKDGSKEIEVRAILFTDMILICKKQPKGSPYQYKMIRPKYMIDKLVVFPKYGVRNNVMEMINLFVVMLDDVGTCYTCFTLTEPSRDVNGSGTLKIWEQKIKEAQYTYKLAVWLYFNPSYSISELDLELASDYGSSSYKQKQLNQEDYNIEREAKERIATMMYRISVWNPSLSTDHTHSDIGSLSTTGRESIPTCRKAPGIDILLNRWKRCSTGFSSRNSRISSYQKSTSATSHDEFQTSGKQNFRDRSLSEYTDLPNYAEEGSSSVNVMGQCENDSAFGLPRNPTSMHKLRSAGGGQKNLQVQNTVVALIHSLPDLSLVPLPNRNTPSGRSPSPSSASEKLYQIHQEQIRSHLSVSSQYLTASQRGECYPPSSPSRASLKRGFAFSNSKPTLSKMGHVGSQSALDQIEVAPSAMPSPVKNDNKGLMPIFNEPGTSYDKHNYMEKESERRINKGKGKEKQKDIGKGKEKEKNMKKETEKGKEMEEISKLGRNKKDGKERKRGQGARQNPKA